MGRLARIVNVFFGILAVCLVVGMAVGGWLFYKHRQADDADASYKGIAKAQALLQELEGGPAAERHGPEMDKARQTLLEARALYNRREYGASLKRVQDTMALLQPVKGELEAPREAARMAAFSGECWLLRGPEGVDRLQVAAEQEIKAGETLKTGGNGACLVAFPNGETVALSGGSSLRLDSLVSGVSGAAVETSLLEGTILVQCPSMVSEEGAGKIRAGKASLTPKPGCTFLASLMGPERVAVEAHLGTVVVDVGGNATDLRGGLEGKRALFTPAGAGAEEALTAPPQIAYPHEGQVFRSKGGNAVQVPLRWDVSRVRSVRFQVADNPLFARGVLVDRSLEGTSSVATGLKEGRYYLRWRAADDPGRSFWSAPLRFRVIALSGEATEPANWTLEVEATQAGDSVLVKGTVKPVVVSLTVNEVEVSVDPDGQFYGTFPPDPQGRKITVFAFDGKGNEKTWTKSF